MNFKMKIQVQIWQSVFLELFRYFLEETFSSS